jgi:hypothetical protein
MNGVADIVIAVSNCVALQHALTPPSLLESDVVVVVFRELITCVQAYLCVHLLVINCPSDRYNLLFRCLCQNIPRCCDCIRIPDIRRSIEVTGGRHW